MMMMSGKSTIYSENDHCNTIIKIYDTIFYGMERWEICNIGKKCNRHVYCYPKRKKGLHALLERTKRMFYVPDIHDDNGVRVCRLMLVLSLRHHYHHSDATTYSQSILKYLQPYNNNRRIFYFYFLMTIKKYYVTIHEIRIHFKSIITMILVLIFFIFFYQSSSQKLQRCVWWKERIIELKTTRLIELKLKKVNKGKYKSYYNCYNNECYLYSFMCVRYCRRNY